MYNADIKHIYDICIIQLGSYMWHNHMARAYLVVAQ